MGLRFMGRHVIRLVIGSTRTPCHEREHDRVRGGAPSILQSGLSGEDVLAHLKLRAKIYDREWTNGALALSGDTLFGPGRFPDKHGKFHWDIKDEQSSNQCAESRVYTGIDGGRGTYPLVE